MATRAGHESSTGNSESSESVVILSDEEESNTLDQAFVGEESASEPAMVVVEEEIEVKDEPLKTPAGSLDTSLNDPRQSPHSSEQLNSSPTGYNLRSRAPKSPFVYMEVDVEEDTREVERIKRIRKRSESSGKRSEGHKEAKPSESVTSTRSATGWTTRSESQERRDKEEAGPSNQKNTPVGDLSFTALNPDNPLVRPPVRRSPRLAAASSSSSASGSSRTARTPTDISSAEENSSEEFNLNLKLESDDDSQDGAGSQEDTSDQHLLPQEESNVSGQAATVQGEAETSQDPSHEQQQPEDEPEPQEIKVDPGLPDVLLSSLEFVDGDTAEDRDRKHRELLQAYRDIMDTQSRATMWYGCPAGSVCPYRSNHAWNATRHYREFCPFNPRRHENRVTCSACGETFVNKAVHTRHHKLKRCKALKEEEGKNSASGSEKDKRDGDEDKSVPKKHRDPKEGDDQDEAPAKRSKNN
jgi:hypothetical protein